MCVLCAIYDKISILVPEGSMVDNLVDCMCDMNSNVVKTKAFLHKTADIS
jgi:hypothetical protein